MKLVYIATLLFLHISCKTDPKDNPALMEVWKNEILETEHQFSKMAQEEGMNIAFLKYVADDGVLLRNDSLIKGKQSIKHYMENATSKGLQWQPDFVDVSASGDLGYTYGEYVYRYQDSTGQTKQSKGIFHTVWKRQPDNSWKFVWD
ncbi:YybH family protein [Aestuariivivens sediminis]|uniref:YybH family protein n=1 Tax=Aestuariivivens sediminis TaxID=2913557 RepID=UPI001F578C53|nr:nuclear transport factor 2 family protein [Aestuariivivens sediminis]